MTKLNQDPDGLLKSKEKTFNAFDSNLVRREYWNGFTDSKGRQIPNKFSVRFDRMNKFDRYVIDACIQSKFTVEEAKTKLGPQWIILRPDEFCIVPHAFYVITAIGLPNGEPIQLTMNLEKSMFKGNKMPSNQMGFNA